MSDKRKKVIMDLVAADFYVPMKEKELAIMLQVSKEDRGELNRILNELLAEGKLSLTKKGKFVKAKHTDKEFIGTFISHPKGFGFVEVDGREEDLYVPENYVNGAFHKDTVKVAMDALRAPIDKLEMIVDSTIWPVPTYGDLMFEV